MTPRTFARSIYTSRQVENATSGVAARLNRRAHPSRRGSASSVALLVPGVRGSLGDEAMTLATVEHLRTAGCARIGLITFGQADDWSGIDGIDDIRRRPAGWPLRWFGFCRWLSRYDALGIIGADVLDGYYSPERSRARLTLARVADGMGLRVVLLGFSYRADPESSALEALKDAGRHTTVLCRDPASLDRVRTLSGRIAAQTADLAFLLNARSDTADLQSLTTWIDGKRANGAFIVGVNCNVQALGSANANEADRLIQAYSRALTDVATKHAHVHFVLIPHDARGARSDEVMARSIYAMLEPAVQRRTYLIDRTWTAAEIKAAAAVLDVAISGRMHFAIACLGSGTPVASFEYQDKFAGMYELFDLRELCVPGTDSLDASAIVRMLELLHVRADALRHAVSARLPLIQELSARNISALRGEPVAGYDY